MHSTAATPSRSEIAQVGFIGLGDMGGAIASRIIAAGFPTHLWARRPEVLDEFSGAGAQSAATPAELAAAVDLVGVCVWDDDAVRDVLYNDDGVLAGAREGTVIAIHSTVQPRTVREAADAAAARGLMLVDAPVSGGREVALSGGLVVAVGGDEATVERCRPVFASFGTQVVHLGPVGVGQFDKLINNALLAANLAVADDAIALAESLGIDPAALAEVIRDGSGRSFGFDVALMARDSADAREQAATALRKDVGCLTTEAAPQQCADAALFTHAARQGVERLTLPPGWER
jgi:3-hydroxyisobutyrate dehydrogenase-like beta-hydroxyacid dehydrogenase